MLFPLLWISQQILASLTSGCGINPEIKTRPSKKKIPQIHSNHYDDWLNLIVNRLTPIFLGETPMSYRRNICHAAMVPNGSPGWTSDSRWSWWPASPPSWPSPLCACWMVNCPWGNPALALVGQRSVVGYTVHGNAAGCDQKLWFNQQIL